MNQKQVNKKLKEIAMQLKLIDTIGLNYVEYLSALIYAIYEIESEPNNFFVIDELIYTVQSIDEQLYKIRKKEKSEKLFINIKFREVIKEESYPIFKNCVLEMKELIENTREYQKTLLAEAFENIISEADKNNEISFQNTEYYTPKEIVKTMVKLFPVENKTSIYNPACGTGNFLVESARSGSIYAFGDESNISNYNICMTNLWLHNIENKKIDEIRIDQMPRVDYAISNPPFTINNMSKDDERFEKIFYRYGVFENASSYSKFIVKMLESVNTNGKVSVIVPHGFLFKKTRSEYNLRLNLIQNSYIDAIIALPEKLFNGTKIPVVILVLQKKYKRDDILYIDASKEYVKERKRNILSEENQAKIIETYKNRIEKPNYSIKVDVKTIIKNDYDLNIKKYIKIKKEENHIDIKTENRELENLETELLSINTEIKEILGKYI